MLSGVACAFVVRGPDQRHHRPLYDISAEAGVAERATVDAASLPRDIAGKYRPVVLGERVADWPAVAAGRDSERVLAQYHAGFGGGPRG